MPPIDVLVVGDADLHAQVAVALAEVGAYVKIRGCARAERLATIAGAQDIGVVVSGLRDAVGASTASALLALKRRNESIPFIISAHLTPLGVRDIVRAIDAGLEVGWVIRDVEDLTAAIIHVVVERVHVGPAAVLLLTGWPLLPAGARGFFSTAAIGAAGPMTILEAARALGMAVRTVQGRLDQSGLPPPHRILGWCRVLHASWYMDRLGWTPKKVTRRMRFCSVPALYNLLHHYSAPRPGALVVQGGFEEMLRCFTDALRR